uniref:Uncharacterized protein n=1 Tax=Glossina austeni TaxID=7395 RepID=A0A1A9V8F5_GLOAU
MVWLLNKSATSVTDNETTEVSDILLVLILRHFLDAVYPWSIVFVFLKILSAPSVLVLFAIVRFALNTIRDQHVLCVLTLHSMPISLPLNLAPTVNYTDLSLDECLNSTECDPTINNSIASNNINNA